MKKCDVVKNNREFDYIIRNNKCIKNSEFIIYYLENSFQRNRYGISVGKKIGNAVTRNYYKRIVRNICDKCKNNYSNSKDYIIIIRKRCLELSFQEIEDSLKSLIYKLEKKASMYEKTN